MNKEELGFYWEAELIDGKIISQFDDKGVEVRFSEVEKNIDKLIKFRLVGSSESKSVQTCEVNLSNRTISIGKDSISVVGKNPKLVYFRRNEVRSEVGTGKILGSRVFHNLGIKTDSSEQVLQIFNGLLMKPQKAEFIDKKTLTKVDMTNKLFSAVEIKS